MTLNPAQVAQVKRLRKQRLQPKSIAKLTGFPLESVRAVVNKPPQKESPATIQRRYQASATQRAIEELLGDVPEGRSFAEHCRILERVFETN
jgi:DNA-binding transcriptional MerR regulator